MTKRFFISYSLITLFLLDSVVLFAQCEKCVCTTMEDRRCIPCLAGDRTYRYIRIDRAGWIDYVVSAAIGGEL